MLIALWAGLLVLCQLMAQQISLLLDELESVAAAGLGLSTSCTDIDQPSFGFGPAVIGHGDLPFFLIQYSVCTLDIGL